MQGYIEVFSLQIFEGNLLRKFSALLESITRWYHASPSDVYLTNNNKVYIQELNKERKNIFPSTEGQIGPHPSVGKLKSCSRRVQYFLDMLDFSFFPICISEHLFLRLMNLSRISCYPYGGSVYILIGIVCDWLLTLEFLCFSYVSSPHDWNNCQFIEIIESP